MRLILIRDYSDWTVDRFNVIRTDIEPQLIVEHGLDHAHATAWMEAMDADGCRWRVDI